LIDLASHLPSDELERAVNEADNHDLIDPEALRAVVGERPGATGVRALRNLLDARTFTLTRSELERRFLPLADRAGLPRPKTAVYVNGFEVDFYWPHLGLVVEADSLRYHRTAAEQTRDHERDQAHAIAGMTPLRFTHFQITYEPTRVVEALRVVASRLAGSPAPRERSRPSRSARR
jgi:very-short-patch-repair endonuclease